MVTLSSLTAKLKQISVAARVDPDAVDGVLGLTLGYRRRSGGMIGIDLGANAYSLRDGDPWRVEDVVTARAGARRALILTEQQFCVDGETNDLFPAYSIDHLPKLEGALGD